MGSSGYQDDTSDEALLSGMAHGDDQACLVFVRRYQHRLFGLAIGIVGDPRLAEEVAQEAFIRIYRHAEVFDPRRASVTAWALTITRNLAIDVLRVRRDVPTDPDDRVFVALMSNDPVADEGLGRRRPRSNPRRPRRPSHRSATRRPVGGDVRVECRRDRTD